MKRIVVCLYGHQITSLRRGSALPAPEDSPRFEADSLRRTEIRFTQFDLIRADLFGEAREIIIEGTNLGASFTDLVVGYRGDLEIDHTLTYDREYELPR